MSRITEIANNLKKITRLGTASERNVGIDSGDVVAIGSESMIRIPSNTNINEYRFSKSISLTQYLADNTLGGMPLSASWWSILKTGQQGWVIATLLGTSPNNIGTTWKRFVDDSGYLVGEWIMTSAHIISLTGQSYLKVMTQKATTDAINGVSDIRDKAEVQDLTLGLDIVMGIEPITFKLNKREWYENDNENNETNLAKDSTYTGFSAQQLKQLFEEKNLSDYGIVKNYKEKYPTDSENSENNTIDRLYVEHNALLPFLVNSIQQLQNQIHNLKNELNYLVNTQRS